MNATANIETTVLAILSDLTALPADRIGPRDHLALDLGLDSVGSMELVGMLDEAFDLEVDFEDAMKIERVDQVMALAHKLLAA
jgi:acyl carrier protein